MSNPFENISPQNYSESSVIEQDAALQMISRLDLVALQPKVMVDIGCGIGGSSELLKKRYPDAELLAVDEVLPLLQYAKKNQQTKAHYLCAKAEQLPLKEYGIDLIFANLLLPWCRDLNAVLHEFQRILKPNGLLMFSTFGLDTLRELPNHLLHLADMHNIGDALVQAGLSDPVMDVDYVTVTYRTVTQLMQELKSTGSIPLEVLWQDESLQKNAENLFPVTYEIVYGHAWGSGAKTGFAADEFGEVRIPISSLKPRV